MHKISLESASVWSGYFLGKGSTLTDEFTVGAIFSFSPGSKSMTRLWKWMESAWWGSHRILQQLFCEIPRAMSGKSEAF